MFSLNEKVVYPGHGVAKIIRIIEKLIGGVTATFFELKFLSKDMVVLVPVTNLQSVGLRKLSSIEQIRDVFKTLEEPVGVTIKDVNGNWNKRNKEYQGKLRSGSLKELCMVYRELKSLSLHKELSFGEKNLLQQTEVLLAQEIAVVEKIVEEKVVDSLRTTLNTFGMKAPTFASQINK